jgi:hypothetical protein
MAHDYRANDQFVRVTNCKRWTSCDAHRNAFLIRLVDIMIMVRKSNANTRGAEKLEDRDRRENLIKICPSFAMVSLPT